MRVAVMTNERNHDFLDDVLKRVTAPRPVDDAAVARVLRKLNPPLPRPEGAVVAAARRAA